MVCLLAAAISARRGDVLDANLPFSLRSLWPAAAGGLGFAGLYFWFCEGRFQATLGKILLRIEVRRRDYAPCGAGAALVRNLLRVVDVVGFILIAGSEARQRVGDWAAGTIVVESERGRRSRGRAASVLAGALVLMVAAAFGAAFSGQRQFRVAEVRFFDASGIAVPQPFRYRPGERMTVSFTLAGYAANPSGHTDLDVTALAMAPDGRPLHALWRRAYQGKPQALQHVQAVYSVVLPGTAPPGECRLTVAARDGVSGHLTQRTLPFQVYNPAVAPATRLEIRDLQLSDVQEGLGAQSVFHPGQAVFILMKVMGMRFRGDDVDVVLDGILRSPDGRVVLDQKEWFKVEGRFPGHPVNFYAPIQGRIGLPRNAAAGVYRVVLTAHDRFGGGDASREARFEVRGS